MSDIIEAAEAVIADLIATRSTYNGETTVAEMYDIDVEALIRAVAIAKARGGLPPTRWVECRGRHVSETVCPVHGVRLRGRGLCPVTARYREALRLGFSAADARAQGLHEWGWQATETERKGANDA
jgi:hypothetical protein